ncbi:MAG: hypothetical protein ACLGIK_06655 [Gemmatimonadota bacterium]
MRLMGSAVAVVVLAAVVGIGSIAVVVTRRSERPAGGRVAAERPADLAPPSKAQVESLQATVEALTSTLDTIREADARLSAMSGVPPADSGILRAHRAIQGSKAAADSLLLQASTVAARLDQLADSATMRRQVKTSRGSVATKPKPKPKR